MRQVLLKLLLMTITLSAIPSVYAENSGPVVMPKTLLSLYQASDAIVVARFAKSEELGTVREDADSLILRTQRHFDVAYVLKGENIKFLTLEDEEFRIPGRTVIEDEFSIVAGDKVLLFLRRSEDKKRLELVDSGESSKKLSPADLAVYEQRIAELSSMYSNGDAAPGQIVDWLLRCIEHPATRWEGAFQLIVDLERSEWLEKHALIDAGERSYIARAADKRPIYSDHLTEDHRRTLADILFAPEQVRSEKTQAGASFVRGDNELIELVAKWGDQRLASYLLRQVKMGDKPSYSLTVRINALLRVLNNGEAARLLNDYSQTVAADALPGSEAGTNGKRTAAAVPALKKIISLADRQLTDPL